MRRLHFFTLFVLFALGACAPTGGKYGNFLPPTSTLDQEKVAADAVQQLMMLHPPARTHLELKQPTPDAFGQAFVKELRNRGYSVLEYMPPTGKDQSVSTQQPPPAPKIESNQSVLDQPPAPPSKKHAKGKSRKASKKEPPPPPPIPIVPETLSLQYIIDQIDTNLYRLILIVGNQTLSRAFVQNGMPAGAWIRREE